MRKVLMSTLMLICLTLGVNLNVFLLKLPAFPEKGNACEKNIAACLTNESSHKLALLVSSGRDGSHGHDA